MLRIRPEPVYVTDTPIVGLKPSELFVLCLVRLWVVHYRNPEMVPVDWREGFAHMHIDAASEEGFDQLFRLIATSATRNLDIRCKRCGHLGEDEGWLLQLVGLLQGDRLAEAAAILGGWLPAGTVSRAFGSAQVFAAGLAARGLLIPPRPVAVDAAQTGRHGSPAACGAGLLH